MTAELLGSNASSPIPVSFTSTPAALKVGQVVIAVTGTPVQLSNTNYILTNGLVISSLDTNNAARITIGLTGLSNSVNGSGNGTFVSPGGSNSVPSGVNLNTVYVNGTAGDVIGYIGN